MRILKQMDERRDVGLVQIPMPKLSVSLLLKTFTDGRHLQPTCCPASVTTLKVLLPRCFILLSAIAVKGN